MQKCVEKLYNRTPLNFTHCTFKHTRHMVTASFFHHKPSPCSLACLVVQTALCEGVCICVYKEICRIQLVWILLHTERPLRHVSRGKPLEKRKKKQHI